MRLRALFAAVALGLSSVPAQEVSIRPVHHRTKDGRDSVALERFVQYGDRVFNMKSGAMNVVDGNGVSYFSDGSMSENPDKRRSSLNSSAELSGDGFVEVRVDGYSFGRKGSNNLEEAVTDAFRKAVEKGTGVSIESFTTVENYMLKKDQITSRAKGMLLPGYEVVEVGYGAAGSNQVWNSNVYKVTLIGKVKVDKSFEEARKEFEAGQVCYTNKDYECARQHYEKAVNLDTSDGKYHFSLAQACRWTGNTAFDEALDHYNWCVDNKFREGDAYASIAAIFACRFYHSPSEEKAREALEKGAALDNPYCKKSLENWEAILKEGGFR